MAAFPSDIPLGFGTRLQPVNQKRAVFYQDNTFHLEELSVSKVVKDGIIEAVFMTEAQRDSLMSFYNTNRDLAFTFDDPNDDKTYSLQFVDEPKPYVMGGGWAPPFYACSFVVVGVESA